MGRKTSARGAQEVVIISHSPLVYWWPAWVLSYILAALTWLRGTQVSIGAAPSELFLANSNAHIVFTVVLVLLILFTNVKMRGIYSVTFVAVILFFTVLFAWLDWWQFIFRWLPYFSLHINLGFYLFFGTSLLIVWLLAFFLFDRLTYWRVRPGQIIEERVIGGGARSFETEGLLFEQRPADLFQQTILGFGAGDLLLKTGGAYRTEISIPNVLLASRTIKRTQRLTAVKPDAVSES